MGSIKERIDSCRKECEDLKASIAQIRQESATCLRQVDAPNLNINLRQRRLLKGHLGKVYALHWASDSKHLVSASQDSKLIIWNGMSTNKTHSIPLRDSWVMTCAFAPSGHYVASGGLDNTCSIFKLSSSRHGQSAHSHSHYASADTPSSFSADPRHSFRELHQPSYVSSCRFVNDASLLVACADGATRLWDVETRQAVTIFAGHESEVTAVSVAGGPPSVFASCSSDCTARVWDLRSGKSLRTFPGHDLDINSLEFFPDNQSIVTASNDASCRLFDLRSNRQLNIYTMESGAAATSVAFSYSGRMLFVGYEDCECGVWDTLTGQMAQLLQGHENRVSCVGVPPDGRALATGSWDCLLKIWA
eukprot:TRINITY_DN925_c0_g1_i6.p1 TRINITY_DN925_c0_g1~~TRINITY_DN925_c0_g1_i6.p1  ORF type:complete len:362 (+),score=25.57 TRINITY_DN925_c0_g1_i6:163-1248(+)